MRIVLTYRSGALSLNVPALDGLTAAEVAEAAYVVTHVPPTHDYGVTGASAIASAYFAQPNCGQALAPLVVGDTVHAAGGVLELVAETGGTPDGWGRQEPVFQVAEGYPAGYVLRLSETVPPPDQIAYAEDSRDRLWTGRGADVWTCLTDSAGRTRPVLWRTLWEDHGPMVPLAPVAVAGPPAEHHAQQARYASDLVIGTSAGVYTGTELRTPAFPARSSPHAATRGIPVV